MGASAALRSQVPSGKREAANHEAMKNEAMKRPGAHFETILTEGGASSSSLPNADALQQHVSNPVPTTGSQMGVDEFSRDPNQANQAVYERREGLRGRSRDKKKDKKKDKKDKGRSRSQNRPRNPDDEDLELFCCVVVKRW